MTVGAQSWTDTVDTIFTTTWMYRQESATEQAYLKTPFIYWLKAKGRVKEQAGYRRTEIPVEYGDNDTVRWVSKGSTVPITDSELVTMAYDEWKYVSVSVVRWFQDDQQNRSKAAMINLAELKMNAAERALWEELERVVFADGTGSNEPNGLQNLITTTPTLGTVHGISRVDNTWWRNQATSMSGESASVYLINRMRTALNDIIKYSRSEIKDLAIMTTQTIYEYYEEEGYEIYQLSDNTLFDAGFDSLAFRGRPLMWAPSAPAGNMYFINTNYMYLIIDPSYWMEMTEWKPIINQPMDRAAQIVCTMQMCCSRPICQLVLHSITTA